MKINGLTEPQRPDTLRPAAANPGAAGTAGTAGTAGAAGAAGTAKTPATGLQAAPRAGLGQVSVSIPSVQPFDAAKVERIKEAIRNGEFQVDSAMVAHQLLTSVNELIRRAH